MIEFKKVSTETFFEYSDFNFSDLVEYLAYIESEGASVQIGISHGCCSVMIKDGEDVVFTCPEELCENCSLDGIVGDIFEFCKLCEQPLKFIDVPREKMASILAGVRHCNVDGDGEYFSVSIKNECMLLEFAPEILSEEVYLSEPVMEFAEEYKRLITDKKHNEFWGSDIRQDMQNAPGEYFVEEARCEFEKGTGITFFATVMTSEEKNVFVGEGVLYRFDGRGECEVAVRVLPEFCGKGYGKMILGGLIQIAENIGIGSLVCNIDRRNLPAIAFTRQFFDTVAEDAEAVRLHRSLGDATFGA